MFMEILWLELTLLFVRVRSMARIKVHLRHEQLKTLFTNGRMNTLAVQYLQLITYSHRG